MPQGHGFDSGPARNIGTFFFLEVRPFVTMLLHTYIKVCVNWKLLPTLFQYGDVFPTEMEYWIKGGVLFLRSSSHLSLAAN